METCEQLEVLLSGFVDGELEQDEREQVQRHLEQCHPCALRTISLFQLRNEAAHVQFRDPPPEEWDEHAKGLFEETTRTFGWFFYVVAALFFLILIGCWTWRSFWQNELGWLYAIETVALLAGTICLLAAVLRRRILAQKTERYRDIIR